MSSSTRTRISVDSTSLLDLYQTFQVDAASLPLMIPQPRCQLKLDHFMQSPWTDRLV